MRAHAFQVRASCCACARTLNGGRPRPIRVHARCVLTWAHHDHQCALCPARTARRHCPPAWRVRRCALPLSSLPLSCVPCCLCLVHRARARSWLCSRQPLSATLSSPSAPPPLSPSLPVSLFPSPSPPRTIPLPDPSCSGWPLTHTRPLCLSQVYELTSSVLPRIEAEVSDLKKSQDTPKRRRSGV